MSLGGYGTLHFAGKHADKITAAAAICGGGNVSDGCKLATILLIQPLRRCRFILFQNCRNQKK